MLKVIPFEELSITTMTLVVGLVNVVDINIAGALLPIRKMKVPEMRPSNKFKLPHCPIPGSIISIRPPGKSQVRGLIESTAPPFKNAVTMCISTKKKNISLKLSTFSIQMCGASSLEDGKEAATHVIEHLLLVQRVMTKVQKQDPATLAALSWISEASRGESTERIHTLFIPGEGYTLQIDTKTEDHLLLDMETLSPPTDVDEEALRMARGLSDYFLYHSDYLAKIAFTLSGPNLISGPLEIKYVHEAMVNYNYSLGFEINRMRLKEMADGYGDFFAHYDNALVTSVTIELPYTPLVENENKRSKNKIPHHTFLVYRSGSVTQSGPGGTLMKEAYQLFMEMITEIYEEIVYVRQ